MQVSRPTFVRALHQGRSVMLVPGGQAELVHTWKFFAKRQLVIYTRHKGQAPTTFRHRYVLVGCWSSLGLDAGS